MPRSPLSSQQVAPSATPHKQAITGAALGAVAACTARLPRSWPWASAPSQPWDHMQRS
jgi:hypothetical protein